MLKEGLIGLKELLLKESYNVNEMLKHSYEAFLNKDRAMLNHIIHEKEDVINQSEMKIDEKCIELVALHQPAAKELREIMMHMKINNDLERVADLVTSISDSIIYLIGTPCDKFNDNINKIFKETMQMLEDSIRAIADHDIHLAEDIMLRDNKVDDLRDENLRQAIAYMGQHSDEIEGGLHVLRIARSLERIADLCTNIAEDVLYIEKAINIKHQFSQ